MKNAVALLSKHISAFDEVKFVLPLGPDHWTETLDGILDWMDKEEISYEIVGNSSSIGSRKNREIVGNALKAHQVVHVTNKVVNLLEKATEPGLVLLWNDEDEECAQAMDRATEKSVPMYDLTDAMRPMEAQFEDDEPEEQEESEEADTADDEDEYEDDDSLDDDAPGEDEPEPAPRRRRPKAEPVEEKAENEEIQVTPEGDERLLALFEDFVGAIKSGLSEIAQAVGKNGVMSSELIHVPPQHGGELAPPKPRRAATKTAAKKVAATRTAARRKRA